MDERSEIVSEEADVNQEEPVSPRFTFMIACLLFAIFFCSFHRGFLMNLPKIIKK
jgi:hypothetical protein